MEQSSKSFFSQLKERKVIRVAVTYIIVAWLVLQIGDVAFEALQIPAWAASLTAVLVLLGFPIALVLAWAYELTPEGIKRDSAGQYQQQYVMADTDGPPSIAVLPFDDMSRGQDQAYFCEGIAEEILNALCKVENLRVASRVSSFRFGGKSGDIAEIGRKLNVKTVLEGSVRKSGDHLRITVQLVNTTDGYHLWSRQYDRTMEDVFELQEEIAESIANTLSLSLKRRNNGRYAQVGPEAYDLFLRGLGYFARHTTQDNVYARQMFTQSIRLAPEFGRAWSWLAYTYGFEYMYFNASDVNLAEARRTSERALELDPNLSEAHVSAGIAHCMRQDYAAAEAEFENAIALDTRNFEAWYFFARCKVHEGDLERAIGLFERASKVRPDDYQSLLLQAQMYVSLGEPELALDVTRKGMERVRTVLELNPDDNRAWNLGAFALLRLGQKDEARRWIETSVANAPMDSIVQYNAACFYALAGDVEKSLDCLQNCLIKVGNISRDWLEHDSDLTTVKDHPRYREIIASFPD